MNKLSLAGSGLYVILITAALHWFGITPDPGTVAQVIDSTVTVAAWVLLIYGQLRRKDLKAGLVRK